MVDTNVVLSPGEPHFWDSSINSRVICAIRGAVALVAISPANKVPPTAFPLHDPSLSFASINPRLAVRRILLIAFFLLITAVSLAGVSAVYTCKFAKLGTKQPSQPVVFVMIQDCAVRKYWKCVERSQDVAVNGVKPGASTLPITIITYR